jgi:hypothetical protein
VSGVPANIRITYRRSSYTPSGTRAPADEEKWRIRADQEGAGAAVAVCRGSIACPVAAVRDWAGCRRYREGPLFRVVNKGGQLLPDRLAAQSVALIVKAYAARLAVRIRGGSTASGPGMLGSS